MHVSQRVEAAAALEVAFGIARERLLIRVHGRHPLIVEGQRFGELKMNFRHIRRQAQRRTVRRNRVHYFVLAMTGEAAPVIRFGKIGRQFDRATETGLRVGAAVQRERDIAVNEPVLRNVRPQLCRALRRFCRIVETVMLIMNQREVVPRVRRLRAGGEHLAVNLLGLRERAGLAQPQCVVQQRCYFFI